MPVRALPAGITARLGDRVVYPALFFEGTFWSNSNNAEQLLNLWSGAGSIVWDSKTWTGGGELFGVGGIEETNELRAIGFEVKLEGIRLANISLVKQGMRQNKAGRLWLALFTEAGALADDPYELKRGKLNVGVVEDKGDSSTITVSYEDRLIDLERSSGRRYTDEDQRMDYPDDGGFRYVTAIQDMQLVIGRKFS